MSSLAQSVQSILRFAMQSIFVGEFLRSGSSLVQSLLCSVKGAGPLIGERVYLCGVVETCLPSFGSRVPSCDRQVAYVKYEALVQGPAAVVGRLTRFTGLDLSGFAPATDRPLAHWQLDTSKQEGRPFHSELFCETINDCHIGRYRDILLDAELAQVEQECEPLLALLARATSVFTLVPDGQVVTRAIVSHAPVREVNG